jgi:hypothetical protein
MKKYILIAIAILAVLPFTVSWNKGLLDTHWEFKRAIIKLPNGEVKDVQVRRWYDYDKSDQIQVETVDGKVYLVHSMNIALINK